MKIIKAMEPQDVPVFYTGIIEWHDGEIQWRVDGLLHREDGPASTYPSGWHEYWIRGKRLNKVKIQQLLELGYPIKTAIKLCSL